MKHLIASLFVLCAACDLDGCSGCGDSDPSSDAAVDAGSDEDSGTEDAGSDLDSGAAGSGQ